MDERFSRLSSFEISGIAAGLRSGRLRGPFSAISLSRFAPSHLVESVVDGLQSLMTLKFSEMQIAILLEAILSERRAYRPLEELVELVTTGPEAPGISNRDTSVVVRDLFRGANKHVMVAGYAVYQGQQVFECLADRMEEIDSLEVSMYLNLPREDGCDIASLVAYRFSKQFRKKHWPPGKRLPEIFFDPRSIDSNPRKRASLHAKCVVVDEKEVFISSANFTRRAQYDNIEVGVLISSEKIAAQLIQHFAKLVEIDLLKPLPPFNS